MDGGLFDRWEEALGPHSTTDNLEKVFPSWHYSIWGANLNTAVANLSAFGCPQNDSELLNDNLRCVISNSLEIRLKSLLHGIERNTE